MRLLYRLAALALIVPCTRSSAQGIADTSVVRVRSAGVTGDLRLHVLTSKVFGNTRRLRVLVPDGYDAAANRDRRYAVLYLADGQNLFDSTTSVFGPHEWKVDETVRQLVGRGAIPPLIVVGVDDAGRNARDHEYLPYPDSESASVNPAYDPHPEGKRYPDFLIGEVIPYINAHYRTRSDAAHTGIGGSSYGGLISAYVVSVRPGIFGRLLVESATFRVYNYQIVHDAASVRTWPERIYLGVGTNEDGTPGCQTTDAARSGDAMVDGMTRFAAVLRHAGLDSSRLRTVIAPCGTHTAGAWAARLPQALTFLFGDRVH